MGYYIGPGTGDCYIPGCNGRCRWKGGYGYSTWSDEILKGPWYTERVSFPISYQGSKKKTMLKTVSTMMKKLLDADTQALVEAGFINGDLELTNEGRNAIWDALFDVHKAALVARAKEVIEEAKKDK